MSSKYFLKNTLATGRYNRVPGITAAEGIPYDYPGPVMTSLRPLQNADDQFYLLYTQRLQNCGLFAQTQIGQKFGFSVDGLRLLWLGK